MSVTASTFSGNSASTVNGGAIDNGDNHGTGAASVDDSTFDANTASDYGGAISNGSGSTGALTATASTFSANTAGLGGGTVATGEYNGAATVWAAADIFGGSCARRRGPGMTRATASVPTPAAFLPPRPAPTMTAPAPAWAAFSGLWPTTVMDRDGPAPAGQPAFSIVPNATSVNLDGTSATLCPTADRGVTSEPRQACDAGSVQEGLPVALPQLFSTPVETELTERPGRSSPAWSTTTPAPAPGRLS